MLQFQIELYYVLMDVHLYHRAGIALNMIGRPVKGFNRVYVSYLEYKILGTLVIVKKIRIVVGISNDYS